MRMAIIGISGRMGRKIYNHFKKRFEIVGVDLICHEECETYSSLSEIPYAIDLVVDFSSPACISELEWAIKNKITTLSGTTGYTDEELEYLEEMGKEDFFWSANYSKGIQLFTKLIKTISKEYDLFDFIEIHASTKKDAPSGTARMLARDLNVDYSKIQSLRLHFAPPIHEIIFSSKNEQISLRHEVTDTTAFLEGFDEKLQEMIGE